MSSWLAFLLPHTRRLILPSTSNDPSGRRVSNDLGVPGSGLGATNQDQSLALALTAMTVTFTPRTGTSPIYKRVVDRLNLAFDDDTRHVLSVAAVLGHRLNDLSLYSIPT